MREVQKDINGQDRNMEKARILIEKNKDSINAEMIGTGKDILILLASAVYHLHEKTKIPISKITEDIYQEAMVYDCIVYMENKDKPFSDIFSDFFDNIYEE